MRRSSYHSPSPAISLSDMIAWPTLQFLLSQISSTHPSHGKKCSTFKVKQNNLLFCIGCSRILIPISLDPTMLTDMMKGNVTNVLPMILIGGWINMTFSGFVTTKVPFPLTLRFKPMLQQGIELLTLDASWVSSASWYFLNVFGLRSIYSLILGQDNAADQSRMMQEQMTGAAMAMPADTNKAFKTEWEALELTDHQWALDDVEEELMAKDLHFEGMFKKELQTSIF
ncbi:ER membrane protein complex subunit 3 isoform X2 [Panthera pardus]|uniref:ER membrane protein complex subunit 3 n=2 Tax=Panthera TaxID=9688 RepID=A0A8C8WPD4_PANLE|nr:ER membrane protein complex subunit 3 isoform X2 [Panthera pardus]XP_042766629.1 ER membrane protein complex subunit 3 isoform X2 [Panthera leo]XP_042835435.1 ER membrane protein complex subunit 3 isoform X2 [Panthera tigris]XP_049496948.1 ER membrane protein complex subunit 3 isoform X2 [Panthera uncia]XP_058582012.1 ER membrane protein complex subunit 3 isoform X2 [Neofelis nebulosa]